MDFDQLQKELKKAEQNKWNALDEFHRCEIQCKDLAEKLRNSCLEKFGKHDMIRDQGKYDFHTHHLCSRCGAYR